MACHPSAFVRGSSSWHPAQVLEVAARAWRMKERSFRQADNSPPAVVAELLMRASRIPFRCFRAQPCLTAAVPAVPHATAAPALVAAMVCAAKLTTAASDHQAATSYSLAVVGRTFASAGIRWGLGDSSNLAAGMAGSMMDRTASSVVETMGRVWLAQGYPTKAFRLVAVVEQTHTVGEGRSTPAMAESG